MQFLPPPLLSLLLMALPTLTLSSPQPYGSLVSDDYMHLIPRNTLFFRQVNDLQSFNSALGGVQAEPITNSGDPKRPFSVGGETFTDFATAAQRTCDDQFNKCSEQANQNGNKGNIKVEDCDKQKNQCNDAQQSAQVKDFQTGVASTNIGPDPDFPDFDLICEA